MTTTTVSFSWITIILMLFTHISTITQELDYLQQEGLFQLDCGVTMQVSGISSDTYLMLGTRLFTAWGLLPAGLRGKHAGLWH